MASTATLPPLPCRARKRRIEGARRVYIESTMHARWVVLGAVLWTAAGNAQVRFNRDIRPIMAGTCFRCHGPDKSSRMAGMRLDLRDEALKPNRNGVAPIVPGDAA